MEVMEVGCATAPVGANMYGDDASDPVRGGLSPEVERFLAPRPTDSLAHAVRLAAAGGMVASMAAAVSLAGYGQEGLGRCLLAARVVALKLTGSAVVADGAAGGAGILLAGLVLGASFGALFGVLVSTLIGRVGAMLAVVAGVTYGLLVWSIGQFVVLESILPNAVILADQHALLVAHVVYGGVLGLLAAWRRNPDPGPHRVHLRRLWG